ncbi:MAG TPA: 2-phospho-L-lactate guanylyltransferase [Roseiflexaceae bacterium]|nr:2-phospho-L-lactate guanylyltransferase [Roseiflexaceae bacterium]
MVDLSVSPVAGRVVAVVPVKNLGRAKGRLAPALAPAQRRELVLAMLADVLGALRAARAVGTLGGYAVISRDAEVLAYAAAQGATPLHDRAEDLNDALAQAASHYARRGAAGLLVLPADVPLVAPAEIARLAKAAPAPGIAVAPSRDGGTNALLVRPPMALPFLFGVGSLARHLDAARARGLPATVFHAAGLSLDVDSPDDLALLADSPGDTAAQRAVRGMCVMRNCDA